MRLDYKKTFLIGFGFFASSIAWSLYNSLVPVMLEQRFLLATTFIGIIMTIDNFFGVIFQPLVGMLSDRTHTRIGRRMPWILIGIPLCAIAFLFIPRMTTLIAMMSVIIGFNFIMSLWRSPWWRSCRTSHPRRCAARPTASSTSWAGWAASWRSCSAASWPI
jgi:Na+/melibiose symporter-like transporter